MVENHGSPCECATFLRLSTLDQLEKVLTHTHQRKNKDTEHASEILESAREKQRAKFITLTKYDEDITVTRHRLPHSKKRITQEQPAREKASYIAK